MEAVREKSKSVWRTKRSVSSCIALDRISFLLHPPSPPSHKHNLKIITKQTSFFFVVPSTTLCEEK